MSDSLNEEQKEIGVLGCFAIFEAVIIIVVLITIIVTNRNQDKKIEQLQRKVLNLEQGVDALHQINLRTDNDNSDGN